MTMASPTGGYYDADYSQNQPVQDDVTVELREKTTRSYLVN